VERHHPTDNDVGKDVCDEGGVTKALPGPYAR